MTQRLITDLFDRWAGKPILVIGGGPSVKLDLPKLGIEPACVISANDHGSKQSFFPVDIYVNVDKIHCMMKVPMEQLLRPLGGMIVNRHSWADYRLCDWRLAGNTGLTAIAVAAALGGNPVIVTGIDMWHGGRLYFHDTAMPKIKKHRRVQPGVTRRDIAALKPLAAFTKGANVRPMSGPLSTAFPLYDPAEVLPPTKPIEYRQRLQKAKTVLVNATQRFRFSSLDTVLPGHQLALSEDEMRNPQYVGRVAPCV